MWFRRDLRLSDQPALDAAAAAAGEAGVVPLLVLDDRLLVGSGAARTAWVLAAYEELRHRGG